MNARELLAISQVSRPSTADDLETLEQQTPASTQIKVVSVGPEGITGTTLDGGEITVSSTAQNFTPRAGDILPVNFTPGVAKAVDNSRQVPQGTPQALPVPIVQSRAPLATDSSVPYQQWFNLEGAIAGIQTATQAVFLPQLGGYVRIAAREELNGQVDSPSDGQVLCLITSANYASVVNKIAIKTPGGATVTSEVIGDNDVTIAEGTATLNYNIGDTIPIGGSLELTFSGVSGGPVAFTIGFLKL